MQLSSAQGIPEITIMTRPELTVDQQGCVQALAALVAREDNIDAFDESGMESICGRLQGRQHILALDHHGDLCGYANINPDPQHPTAELAVLPSMRRKWVGSRLVKEILLVQPAVAIWAHGALDAALSLGKSMQLERSRELLVLERLHREIGPVPRPAIPDGISVENYSQAVQRLGRDVIADRIIAVNNEAFAWHPEQGDWDAAEYERRTRLDWFNPEGLFLAFAGDELLGFHWTKQHDAADGSAGFGEVYIVAISAAAQGKGIGSLLTATGVAFLEQQLVESVVLYVEGDNLRALNTYFKLGFTSATVHTALTSKSS